MKSCQDVKGKIEQKQKFRIFPPKNQHKILLEIQTNHRNRKRNHFP